MNIFLVLAASTILALTLTSGWIKAELWGSEAMICLFVGIAVGPLGFDLVSFDPVGSEEERHILEQFTRLTIALSVMSAALSLPPGYLSRNWRALALVLGPGMLAMWAVSSGVVYVALGLALPMALLVGASLTPTDPVLARSIVTGRIAEKCVPAALRRNLTAESGINDGLALPLVVLSAAFLDTASDTPRDAILIVIWEVVGAVLLGWILGKATGYVFRLGHEKGFMETKSLTATTLTLALLVLGCVALLKADGILAVFVAGIVLNRAMKKEHQTAHEHFQDAVDRSFTLPIFILLGASLPYREWLQIGWPIVLAAGAIILFRRLPFWMLLQKAGKPYENRSRTLFAGWFGPVGVAALFYASLGLDKGGDPILWHITSLTVAIAVVAFGISGTPLTKALGRKDGDG